MNAYDARHEARIVWLRPLADLPRYVRQAAYCIPRRVGISRQRHRGVVGYAELRPDARPEHPGMFMRRVFTLAPHDPYVGGGAPSEAVDPLTVAPGVPGVKTDRCYTSQDAPQIAADSQYVDAGDHPADATPARSEGIDA